MEIIHDCNRLNYTPFYLQSILDLPSSTKEKIGFWLSRPPLPIDIGEESLTGLEDRVAILSGANNSSFDGFQLSQYPACFENLFRFFITDSPFAQYGILFLLGYMLHDIIATTMEVDSYDLMPRVVSNGVCRT